MAYNLSYSMQMYTTRIIEIQKKLGKSDYNKLIWPLLIIGLYIVFSIERYLNYLNLPFLTGSTIEISNLLRIFDYIMFIAFVVVCYLLIKKSKTHLLYQEEFNKLKDKINNSLGANFCNCNAICNCKDEYLKDMGEKGIDLL